MSDKSDKNEIIAEEIYEYYQDKLESAQTEETEAASEEPGEKKTVISSVTGAISDITDKLAKNTQDKSGVYITFAVLASVIIIMCGCLIGILIPKNEALVEAKTEKLRSSSAKYSEAKEDNERLNERVNSLYDDQAEVRAELNGITDYEAIRDRAKQDIDDISKQIEELKSQNEAKQAEINELDAKIKDMGGKVTLKPGMYTAGKHIAAGEYSVKGDGSMLVSDSEGKLKINTKLTKSASVCRLSDGDTIKLETEAEFNPAE